MQETIAIPEAQTAGRAALLTEAPAVGAAQGPFLTCHRSLGLGCTGSSGMVSALFQGHALGTQYWGLEVQGPPCPAAGR